MQAARNHKETAKSQDERIPIAMEELSEEELVLVTGGAHEEDEYVRVEGSLGGARLYGQVDPEPVYTDADLPRLRALGIDV